MEVGGALLRGTFRYTRVWAREGGGRSLNAVLAFFGVLGMHAITLLLWLIGLAIFLSTAFRFDLAPTIVVTGVIVMIITMLGGSWSTTASDFVQMLLLMPVTLVAALDEPADGQAARDRGPRRYPGCGRAGGQIRRAIGASLRAG